LSEVGLPPGAIPVALLFFNVGVEVGQVLFIFGVLGACGGAVWVARAMAARAGDRLAAPWAAERFAVAAAYVIGAVAMFWVIERTLTFWA
jgi:hypothetical protein